jgi:L-malate glycosyltransferase
MPVKVLVISDYRETASVRPEAELFIGLKKAGVEVEIMTFGDAGYAGKFRAAGIRVIDFHPKKKFDKKEIAFIREVLTKGGYHVVHLFNSRAIINGIRAAKNLPVKVVLYRGYPGNVHWYDPTAYVKYLHPRVDKILCNSAAVEEHFHRQLFFDKKKTITIPKGHSLAWYEHIKPHNLADFGIPGNGFAVSCVANARSEKGIPYLLEATYHLPPELPVFWLLTGRNMDAGGNRRLIDQSPNSQKIKVLGYRKDALRIVAACNAHLLTSIRAEDWWWTASVA